MKKNATLYVHSGREANLATWLTLGGKFEDPGYGRQFKFALDEVKVPGSVDLDTGEFEPEAFVVGSVRYVRESRDDPHDLMPHERKALAEADARADYEADDGAHMAGLIVNEMLARVSKLELGEGDVVVLTVSPEHHHAAAYLGNKLAASLGGRNVIVVPEGIDLQGAPSAVFSQAMAGMKAAQTTALPSGLSVKRGGLNGTGGAEVRRRLRRPKRPRRKGN